MNTCITATCIIRPGTIWVNGTPHYKYNLPECTDAVAFAEHAYRSLGLTYPKFFKMDPVSKLGLLAADRLLSTPPSVAPPQRHLLLFGNTGSLMADWNHQRALNEGRTVSPAVFVYTLPNIVVGELCIRHQFMGENGIFLTPAWQPQTALMMVNSLLTDDPAGQCVTGWIDVHFGGYEVFFCRVERQMGQAALPFDLLTLWRLYADPAAQIDPSYSETIGRYSKVVCPKIAL